MKLTPLIKGLITGIVMIGLSIGFYYANLPANSPLPFTIFAAYALGIVWTLKGYQQNKDGEPSFAEYFQQGFKCFIIVTLMMVVFTGAFARIDKKTMNIQAEQLREQRIEEKAKLKNEIDEEVVKFKKQYPTFVMYGAIFQFLVYGTIFTLITAGSLKMRTR